jgi:hypothetical protein
MRNKHMDLARWTLRRVRRELKDPHLREDIDDALGDLDRAEFVYGKWIDDAKMIGVRNPAFDGDYVGYPEDDFEQPGLNGKKADDDEDDEEKKP